MRTKAFVMTMGLAATLWISSGCQHTPAAKHAALPCANGSCAASSSAKAPKASLGGHAAVRPRPLQAKNAVAGCSTCSACAKCSGGDCDALATVKATSVVAGCTSCAAKTDGREVVVNMPYISAAPAQGLPTDPTSLPAAVSNIPITPAQATSNYGPGVDVVAGAPADTLPAGPAPGERTVDANNVMTVRFGHANNYQIVVGQVYQFRRSWRLRYTAVESDDRYGGSFTLIGDNLDNLKDGQMVRVEGAVLPTDDRVAGSRYQVNRVEILEPDVK